VIQRNRISVWWVNLAIIIALGGALRLSSYRFSLPYIDHTDEPAFYQKAQEWRGLYDTNGYIDGYPPLYIGLNEFVQVVSEPFGVHGLADTIGVLRLISVGAGLLTMVLIALSARLAAGNLAGLIGAAVWGLSPLILARDVYATPDPLTCTFVALALLLAIVAMRDPKRSFLCVVSVAIALLAILTKYPFVTAVVPGMIVAALIFLHDKRRGAWYLAIQTGLIALTGFWLIFIYGASHLKNEALRAENSVSNLFRPDYFVSNLYYTLTPTNVFVFLVAVICGGLAYYYARHAKWKRVNATTVLLCTVILITVPWLISTFDVLSDTNGRLKDVLPGTIAACILLGMAAEQIVVVVGRGRDSWRIGLLVTAPFFVFIPQLIDDMPLVQDRLQPDRRVALREWVDINLDPGTIVVDRSNEKTFNPYWGGIIGKKWFDWWVTDDVMEHSVADWRNNRNMSYAEIPDYLINSMQDSTEGRAYLQQLLHLRDFTAPAMRGPAMSIYRLWGVQNRLNVDFEHNIHLLGFDLSTPDLKPGDMVTIRLYFRATQAPQDNYNVFIHLDSPSAFTPIAQADGAPGPLERPTLSWTDPTETIISRAFQIQIPATLVPGQYRLLAGLYNYQSGKRLSVGGADYTQLSTIWIDTAKF